MLQQPIKVLTRHIRHTARLPSDAPFCRDIGHSGQAPRFGNESYMVDYGTACPSVESGIYDTP
ncbi:hypothetical protein GCM10023259_076760 [Thermocatellispora tengchongensis]